MQQQKSQQSLLIALILTAGYITIQFISNLTVAKTVVFFIFTIPIGSLLYAVSFTWIDLINDYLGAKLAKRIVLISIVCNIFSILWFNFYIYLKIIL